MRRLACLLLACTLIGGCTSSEPDIDALVDARVEAALAQQDTLSRPEASSDALLTECADLAEAQAERINANGALAERGTSAVDAMDMAEFRRVYQLSKTSFDEILAFDAEIVSRCAAVALSVPGTAAAWRDGRQAHHGLVASYGDVRAMCREHHEFFEMHIDDC